ncbi:MAG: hypothetical protein NWT08_04740 [Akkermansiaceae bacterium]|jgi:hypothetical protein|nr:hypothetical protein [Akkermansiaceae bacterium]MDP4848349.1 hypothetical protein [Akkermansiaceae bacterium]MDP4899220.1 hypothetical protein [Akkermansiaceae bacterium]MDP4995702.1 hypothetical protein [Akkermansiaceae bacterium]
MKTIISHLLAVVIGVLTALLLRPAIDDQKSPSGETQQSERVKRDRADSAAPRSTGTVPRIDGQQLVAELSREITASDLEKWLAECSYDVRSLAEAQAIAGLLTNNPDLVLQAIEADPENPHLLYIGATLSSINAKERLALSERFFQQDTGNALAGYIYASQLFETGDIKKGIEIMKGSQDQPKIDAYAKQTQLLMDDAFIAAGDSPSMAKIRSVLNSTTMPYFSDLQSLAGSINDLGDSLTPEEAADLRSLSASMGSRLSDQGKSSTYINHLVGLSLEKKALAGLPDSSPSPYEGLTVGEARQSIANEREELFQVINQTPMEAIISGDPELVDRYFDRVRLVGEQEASMWWLEVTSGQK